MRALLDLAQQQRRPLRLGQGLDVGHELAQVLAHLHALGRRRAVGVRQDVHRVLPLGHRLTKVVEAAVAGDPVEPGPHVDLAIVREHRRVGVGEDLLEHVLGIGGVARHSEGVRVQLLGVRHDVVGERGLVGHRPGRVSAGRACAAIAARPTTVGVVPCPLPPE